jgi:hypothetical protein
MGKIGDLLDIFCDNVFDNKKNQFFFFLFVFSVGNCWEGRVE